MTDLQNIYVKDYRAKVDIEPSAVRRYDSKYYYLTPDHKDSKFNTKALGNLLGFGDLLLTNMNRYTYNVVASEVAAQEEISTVQAIGLLIFNEYVFDALTETWHRPEVAASEKTENKFVITTAQSNTSVHPFFHSLVNYCEMTGAQLKVLPLYYGVKEDSDKVWFAEEVLPYLCFDKSYIGDSVQVLGDLRNTATAVNPLSGIKPITQGYTTIVPSTHLMLERIAVPRHERPVAMWATGCVTNQSYRKNQKAGYKADFHHTLSAVRVEIDSDRNHHIRSLSGNSKGHVLDMGKFYTDTETGKLSFDMVLGDLHIGSTCNKTYQGFLSMIESVGKPDNLIIHDSFDGETINPHEANQPFAKFKHTFESLDDELDSNANVLNELAEHACTQEVIVVYSNHNDFLNRWLKRVDWRKLDDVTTARIYLHAATLASEGELEDFYEYEMRSRDVAYNVRFLTEGENYSPKGVHCGFHGNHGSGGAKGSIKGFSHLGMKTVIGHRHVSGWYKGCLQVGTFTKLVLGYMSGLNACDNSLAFVHEGGKRQLVEIYQGEWQA